MFVEALRGLFDSRQQTAESQQTADLIKNSKFSFSTSLLWAVSASEASKWLIWEK